MAAGDVHPADRLAFDRAMVAEPVWNRIQTAADAVGLLRTVLLHAGPPFAAPAEIPAPILNSACVAAVYEGLARTLDEAEQLILAGEFSLQPAQDHGVVVPLAAVVSASMPLHGVYDAHRGSVRVFAPINGGSGPALRLGMRSMAAVEHLKWLNGEFAEALRLGIAEGIPLVPLAAASLARGDDCHGRTPAATGMLIEELRARGGGNGSDRIRSFLETSPSLFLNLWMAGSKCAMAAAQGVEGSGLVTAAGANGHRVGIQVSGLPGRWFAVSAAPPRGEISGAGAERALGAIGDSAVVEAFGLGAMAVQCSPEQAKVFQRFLPGDAARRREALPVGRHLGFAGLGLRLGLSARHVVSHGAGPLVGLGILDRLGKSGRIGGGIYEMPVRPFADALTELGAEPA